ncbi:MAG TPA: FHA domain-containing protein [Polyangiaceae bacterium]|nr:FHA domain-containing protein [Polyangiaceae bacterium]
MPEGEFVIGRSSNCHLALDDALVSRRHAILHVGAEYVEVEDLRSRNGVQVNGVQIHGRQRLKHLDRVVIGAQELLLVQRDQAAPTLARGTRPTLGDMTLDLPLLDLSKKGGSRTEGSVLNRIAEKALALGRFEEAERMLARRLTQLLVEVRGGAQPSQETLRITTDYAMQLASGLAKGYWLEWVFGVHDACNSVLNADTINALHSLVRQIRYSGGPAFRSYMANLRARAAQLSKPEQFLVRRLESIERVVGA